MNLAASSVSRAHHGGLLLIVFVVADHHCSSPAAGLGARTLRGFELALQQLQCSNRYLPESKYAHSALNQKPKAAPSGVLLAADPAGHRSPSGLQAHRLCLLAAL